MDWLQRRDQEHPGNLLDAGQWPVRPDPAASCGIENVQSPLNYRSSEKSEIG